MSWAPIDVNANTKLDGFVLKSDKKKRKEKKDQK